MTTPPPDRGDTDLNVMLENSNPVPPMSLRMELLAQAVAREPMRRSICRPLLVGVGLFASGVLGVGSAAVAGVGPLAEFVPGHGQVVRSDLSVSDGDRCSMVWRAGPEAGVSADDPAVVAARTYLANLDFDAIDISDKVVELKRSIRSSVNLGGTRTTPPEWTRSGLESHALNFLVFDMTQADLRSQSLDPDRVALTSDNDCGQPAIVEQQ